MQIAVVSNLHGNLPALESIISETQSLKEHGREIERIYIVGVLGFMPYPRGVYDRINNSDDFLVPVKGKYDQLISKYHELDEDALNELKDLLPQFVIDMVEWNRDVLDKDERSWLHYMPSYVTEKFGENEFFFVYGDIFKQVEEPVVFEQSELKPKMPESYYERFLEPLRTYEIVVGGRSHYVAETRYGKVVCPGSAGLKPTRDAVPHFAVIDTVNTDVSFFEFDFEKTNTYEKIKEFKLPGDTIDLLYHGYQSYKGFY